MKKTGAPGECFLHAQSDLSKFNTGLIMRLLHLLYDIKVIIIMAKKKKHTFSMLYTLIKHRFLTNQSGRKVVSIL